MSGGATTSMINRPTRRLFADPRLSRRWGAYGCERRVSVQST
jgi:hypothetical protein